MTGRRKGQASSDKSSAGRDVVARVVAAVLLNYILTSLMVACLARLLPLKLSEASIAATLASFAIFAVLAIVVFSVRSVGKVWVWMVSGCLLFGAALWVSLLVDGRV